MSVYSCDRIRDRSRRRNNQYAMALLATPVAAPGSAVERWVGFVLAVCQSEADPKTLNQWARIAGVSRTGLCECCRMVHVVPRDARDLARVLRALRISVIDDSHLEANLDVRDSRTLRKLRSKAGLEGEPKTIASPLTFLDQQRFITPANEGIRRLRTLFQNHCSADRSSRTLWSRLVEFQGRTL